MNVFELIKKNPSPFHCGWETGDIKSRLAFYYLNKITEFAKVSGLPDTIPERELKRILLTERHGVIFKEGDNLIFAHGAPGGKQDIYYEPSSYIVSNPHIKGDYKREMIIGKDCAIVLCDSYVQGIIDIIDCYTTLIAHAYTTLRISLINTRIPAVFSAATEHDVEAARNFYENIERGELCIMEGKRAPGFDGIEVKPFAPTTSNALQQQIEAISFLEASLNSALGLAQNSVQGREYISDSDKNGSALAYSPYIDNMLNSWNSGFEQANKLFGTNIRAELNSAWKIQNAERKESLTDDLQEQT